MERTNFAQVLETAGVDLQREYHRLITMFYYNRHSGRRVVDEVEEQFDKIPFTLRGTCISLDDFDETSMSLR